MAGVTDGTGVKQERGSAGEPPVSRSSIEAANRGGEGDWRMPRKERFFGGVGSYRAVREGKNGP